MLEIINGIPNGVPKDKDRDTWSVIQKEFPCKCFIYVRNIERENTQSLFENSIDHGNELTYFRK
jgi:hypothetical protein